MLSLSKRVDYALIALAHLAERPGRVSPAREIARAYDLPLPLLMNILKELNQSGWVRSSRGVKGGYEIGIDPNSVSLHDLILMLDGPVQTIECVTYAAAPHATDDVRIAVDTIESILGDFLADRHPPHSQPEQVAEMPHIV